MYILLKIILGAANLKRFPVVLHLGVAVFKFVIWGGISLDIRSEIFFMATRQRSCKRLFPNVYRTIYYTELQKKPNSFYFVLSLL